jgi:hypothetical protein
VSRCFSCGCYYVCDNLRPIYLSRCSYPILSYRWQLSIDATTPAFYICASPVPSHLQPWPERTCSALFGTKGGNISTGMALHAAVRTAGVDSNITGLFKIPSCAHWDRARSGLCRVILGFGVFGGFVTSGSKEWAECECVCTYKFTHPYQVTIGSPSQERSTGQCVHGSNRCCSLCPSLMANCRPTASSIDIMVARPSAGTMFFF